MSRRGKPQQRIRWLLPIVGLLLTPIVVAGPQDAARKRISGEDCLAIASELALARYDGRFTGTEGGRLASAYVARRFASIGLVPGGDGGTHFQSFPLPRTEESKGGLTPGNALVLYQGSWDRVFRYGVGYSPLPQSPEGCYRGDVVYLGTPRGGTAAAMEYTEERLRGKIAVFAAPREGAAPLDTVRVLAGCGCQGVVLLRGAASRAATSELTGVLPIPVVELSPLATQEFVATLGAALMSTGLTRSGVRPVHVEITTSKQEFVYGRGRNVIGILPGVGKRSEEVVVIGAHYDHLGRGTRGGISRGTPGEIHNGANDNASGIAALLEIADALKAMPAPLARTIIFIAFDAEEINRRGSRYYVKHPTTEVTKMAALLNMDMIGRNGRNHIHACRLPAYEGLNQLTAATAVDHNIALDTARMEMLVARSDIAPFAMLDVPSVCFFSGEHPGYHTETDDAQLLDPEKMEKIARMIFDLTLSCAAHQGSFRRHE